MSNQVQILNVHNVWAYTLSSCTSHNNLYNNVIYKIYSYHNNLRISRNNQQCMLCRVYINRCNDVHNELRGPCSNHSSSYRNLCSSNNNTGMQFTRFIVYMFRTTISAVQFTDCFHQSDCFHMVVSSLMGILSVLNHPLWFPLNTRWQEVFIIGVISFCLPWTHAYKSGLEINILRQWQCSRCRRFWAIIRGFSRTDAVFQICLRPVDAVFEAVRIGL